MASFDYAYSLHFKGEQKDKNLFEKHITKALAEGEVDTGDYGFEDNHIWATIENTSGEVYNPFEPFIKKFPNLSFFFAVEETTCSAWSGYGCGYYIFEKGVITGHKNWSFKADDYDEEDALESALADKDKTYEKNIVKALNTWLSAKNNLTGNEKNMTQKIEYYYEDNVKGYMAILFKGTSNQRNEEFVNAFLQKCRENEEDDEGYEHNVVEKETDKMVIEIDASYSDDFARIFESIATGFIDLNILQVTIYRMMEDDGRAGYSYTEINKGKKTELSASKTFYIGDYDDAALEAMNESIEHDLEPIVTKWLESGAPPASEAPA